MREILKSIVCGALLASAAPLAAITINVPADKPTIQAGIDFAVAGDIVQVAAGTYNERIDFKGKAITVRSAAGPATTFIDGQQLGPVVHFHTGEGQGTILRGFTIRNGKASSNTATQDGGGIRMSFASPRIINNVISNNFACSGGGGISVYQGNPLISGNTISGNSQSGCSGGTGGGGIGVVGGTSAQITNNTIQSNTWSSAGGGGISLNSAGSATLSNNTISGNSSNQGGGISIVNASNMLLQQNRITGNTASTGAGIYWVVPLGSRGPRLVNNTIADNNATFQASGIYADGFDDQVNLVNNVIAAKTGQTAVYCGSGVQVPIFSQNDVYAPSGTPYAGACVSQTGVNGNISANPLFAAVTYYLQAGSPCIDKGDGMTADIPATDFGGGVRIRDGNGDGSIIIDMGIDEF